MMLGILADVIGMGNPKGQRRDFEALKSRRMKAAKMFSAGKSQAEVARELKVSRQSASRWHHAWAREGRKALEGAGRAGRRPKLDERQLMEVAAALRVGPRAHGFQTDLWTLSRLAKAIGTLTGVRYHPGHVWRLMDQMGWSLQRPAKRAKERNEQAIREWKAKEWPRIKKRGAG